MFYRTICVYISHATHTFTDGSKDTKRGCAGSAGGRPSKDLSVKERISDSMSV